MKRIAIVLTALLLAVTGLAACGHDNYKDLKGVKNVHPAYIENVENMDGHPNLGFLCIHGVPVLTTTRNNAGDVTVLHQASAIAFCAKHK